MSRDELIQKFFETCREEGIDVERISDKEVRIYDLVAELGYDDVIDDIVLMLKGYKIRLYSEMVIMPLSIAFGIVHLPDIIKKLREMLKDEFNAVEGLKMSEMIIPKGEHADVKVMLWGRYAGICFNVRWDKDGIHFDNISIMTDDGVVDEHTDVVDVVRMWNVYESVGVIFGR